MSIHEQTADVLRAPPTIELPVPVLDENFFVCREVMSTLGKFDALSRRHPVNILVTGNQGCGKSSLARQFAAFYGRPLATFQVGLLAEAGQLFGQQRLKGGRDLLPLLSVPHRHPDPALRGPPRGDQPLRDAPCAQ